MNACEEFMQEVSDDNKDLLLLLREAMGLVAYYRHLLERFELDLLTGLPCSNKFHDYTAEIGSQAADVGVIFFDVNDLKYYNDTKGHQAGDLLLQKASESILHIAGNSTRAFRIGGDEFAVIISNCSQASINEIIEKWRNKLAELNKIDDGIHCSIAMGAAIGAQGDKIGDVLKLADERMYEDKKRIKEGRKPWL